MAMQNRTKLLVVRSTVAWIVGTGLSLVIGCGERATEPQTMTPATSRLSADEERARARHHERLAERAEKKQAEPEKKGALERVQLRRQEEMHREHARLHEQLAAQLERFDTDECRSIPSGERATCPLLGPEADVTSIDGGVRLTFASGTDTSRVLAKMRCHAAFARAEGYAGMESCPLYHRGLTITESNDGRSIDLTSNDPTTAAELQHEAELHFGR